MKKLIAAIALTACASSVQADTDSYDADWPTCINTVNDSIAKAYTAYTVINTNQLVMVRILEQDLTRYTMTCSKPDQKLIITWMVDYELETMDKAAAEAEAAHQALLNHYRNK